MDSIELSAAVREASQRPDVRNAVAAAYAELQTEIDVRRPVCVVSGRCCRFEEYGHRLYLTTIELAAFFHDLGTRPMAAEVAESIEAWDGAGCPFQVRKMCGVHSFRPLGCRMFFCDATSTDWQNAQYEHFHSRVKRLHEELCVPYAYVEWRVALKAMGIESRK